MIDEEKQKEIVDIFKEYKKDLGTIERLIRENGMPENLLPIFAEQMQMRAVGKSMHKAYVTTDKKEITREKAKEIKNRYTLLMEQGFEKDEALQLMTGYDYSDEPIEHHDQE